MLKAPLSNDTTGKNDIQIMNHEILNTTNLAAYAARNDQAKRFHDEEEGATRSPFQRDRDRIIHCAAFRRLQYKTQVFIYHEGDHFRTRLTHSLEVAQVAKSIARALQLDEDLVEALSLAHDLGHTPFGHSGEVALNECMTDYGGFDHNAQSLKIVTKLEKRYAEFDGLNLTKTTLEGLVKHNGPLLDAKGNYIGAGAQLPHALAEFSNEYNLDLSSFPTLEAQVAALSDDIAYNSHDIDDGLRANLITLDDLRSVELTAGLIKEVEEKYSNLERPRLIHETLRRVITAMIFDVLAQAHVAYAQDKASHESLQKSLIAFSPKMQSMEQELKEFLNTHIYKHEIVLMKMDRAKKWVGDLFAFYMDKPSALPIDWQIEDKNVDVSVLARQVCDFIAGMTDRFAMDEYRRIFDLTPIFR